MNKQRKQNKQNKINKNTRKIYYLIILHIYI
jgi:hypothetical protein